jgi:hypothetical protein
MPTTALTVEREPLGFGPARRLVNTSSDPYGSEVHLSDDEIAGLFWHRSPA